MKLGPLQIALIREMTGAGWCNVHLPQYMCSKSTSAKVRLSLVKRGMIESRGTRKTSEYRLTERTGASHD